MEWSGGGGWPEAMQAEMARGDERPRKLSSEDDVLHKHQSAHASVGFGDRETETVTPTNTAVSAGSELTAGGPPSESSNSAALNGLFVSSLHKNCCWHRPVVEGHTTYKALTFAL